MKISKITYTILILTAFTFCYWFVLDTFNIGVPTLEEWYGEDNCKINGVACDDIKAEPQAETIEDVLKIIE